MADDSSAFGRIKALWSAGFLVLVAVGLAALAGFAAVGLPLVFIEIVFGLGAGFAADGALYLSPIWLPIAVGKAVSSLKRHLPAPLNSRAGRAI